MVEIPTMGRGAVLVVPPRACLDWVDSCFLNDRRAMPDENGREPPACLIPENNIEPAISFRRHYRAILATGLKL